ncbi:SH3 domain-containing protein [Lachnospiraceae bacterium A10]|nr:SH3 domain-containing protein [Lachnospiraceae bacterium A10]
MKKRLVRALSIVCCGTLLAGEAGYVGYAGNTTASQSSSSALAGISAATVMNLNDYDQPITAVDTATTGASGYGYTNLGICQVEGNLNIRESASEEASLVGKLPNEAGCEIVATEGDWYQITSGEVSGYVKASYILTGQDALNLAATLASTKAVVNTNNLRVRSEMSTDASVMTTVSSGEELEVLEQLDGWVKVSVDSDEGYVSSEYVTVVEGLNDAMTLTEARYGEGVSDVRVDLINNATQYVGNPYVWGGTSLTHGADCSGFVMAIYAQYGISLPHSSRAQANYGTKISASEAQPGDLFFYGSGKSISHVAIYIGNGQIVHASSKKTGIKISNAFYRNPICVTRLISE